jgi:hypothetical protein
MSADTDERRHSAGPAGILPAENSLAGGTSAVRLVQQLA